nr:CRISPR-associated protein Cas9 [uncultured bacterium]
MVLGLDVGTASIGWGLVKLREEEYPSTNKNGQPDTKPKIVGGEILKTGVRTFKEPEDDKGKSLAITRGLARRGRWRIKRNVQRLKNLIKLAKEFNLVSNDLVRGEILEMLKTDKGVNKKEKWDIWGIRKEALERKLSDTELFRVLYHIAKHRGSYFHMKAEFLPDEEAPKNKKQKKEGADEKEKVKKGLRQIQKMLKDSPYKTIGALFYATFKQTNPKGSNKKRNAPGEYTHSIRRELLRDEIEIIFQEQQRLGNTKAKPELLEKYIDDILMYEKEADEDKLRNMMGRCEFEFDEDGKGKVLAPKESYTSEKFTLFNRLNSLTFGGGKDDIQRDQIIALAHKNAKVTFSQIRNELKLQEKLHLTFNLCSYAEKNPEYKTKLECEIRNNQLQFEDKHKLSIVNINTGETSSIENEIKEIFIKKFNPEYKKIYVYYSDIRKQLNLSGDLRFTNLKDYTKSIAEFEREYNEKNKKNPKPFNGQAEYIKQFEDKDVFVKLDGYHKIKNTLETIDSKWQQIKDNADKLDIIAEAVTYCKSDKTRTEYLRQHGITDKSIIDAVLTIDMSGLANFSKQAMNNLLKYMDGNGDGHLLFHEAKEKCGYGKKDYEKQAVLQPYKGFFEKNPVVARVISQTRKLVNAIVRDCKDEYAIDQIHIEVATELANSKDRKIDIITGQRRYKEEKVAAEERCMKWDIDPDKGDNLLKFRLAEQQGNECPYTGKKIMFASTTGNDAVYILDCEIDHVIPMSRSFNDSLNNKVLCSPEANQNKRDRIPYEWFEERYGKESEQWHIFENRVKKMYGVPYPKKKNLLRKSWTDEDKERFLSRNLNDTRYAARHIADYLRKYFDFSKSRIEIKDESRIQLRSGGITAFLRHIWGLNKDREANDLHHAIDAIVVACSTYGHVFLVSNLSKEMERKGKSWFKHFNFLREKFKPWKNIREDILSNVNQIFVSRMPRHKVTSAAHEDTVSRLDNKNPPKNRHIKINKGYAKIGEMVRADVFVDKDGMNYVVPIYAVDMFSKNLLPDKYVPDDSKVPYDEWPSADIFDFKFSLFKDDLIGINNKMYYVSFFEAATTNVNVKNIDGSMFPDKMDAQDPYTKKICYRPKSKTRKCILKKYSIDTLGNHKEIEQETRLGNDRVKRGKKPKKNG